MENQEKSLLLEKYFPKTWEDIQLPTKVKTLLTEMQKQFGYRLLLHSSPGTGKSSSARLMVSDSQKFEVLYLSGSNDFNIETLRSKVMTFASGFSVLQKHKVCIIDECENIRDNIQDAFKILLDQCKKVSFIFITNEVEKVNTAIRSRCTQIEYDFSGDDLIEQQKNFIKFTKRICEEQNIPYEKSGIKQLYIRLFPDFRHLIVTLQQIKDTNQTLTVEAVKSMSENGKQMIDLYNLICEPDQTMKNIYETSTKFKGKERECFVSLGEPFFEYLNDQDKYNKTLEAAVIVSKYSDMFVTSINKFVTLLSCIVELRSIFR